MINGNWNREEVKSTDFPSLELNVVTLTAFNISRETAINTPFKPFPLLFQYTLKSEPIQSVNSFPPGQNGRHFADNVIRCILLNEKFFILIKISLKFVPKGPINNNPALVQIMACRQTGDKPLSEPMMAYFTDSYMHHSTSMS